MIKTIKDNIEKDLNTIDGLTVLSRNIVDKTVVGQFPAVSLVTVSFDENHLGDGESTSIHQLGLAIFVQGDDLGDQLDDLYEDIKALEFKNAGLYLIGLEFKGGDYDVFADGSDKGALYISFEIEFLN